MKRYITPTWTINSVYDITPESLIERGVQGVICDLDNTLIAWNEGEYSTKMAEWVQALLDANIRIYLLSNNHHNRVHRVAHPLALDFTADAYKPLKRNFKRALKQLQLPKNQVVVIGDQVMTDVIGANLSGMRSILVKPIASNDIIYTVVNRHLEKVAMKVIGLKRKGDWGNQLD